MNSDLYFQQFTTALQRVEAGSIIFFAIAILVILAINGVILYLMFGRVLIPLTRSLCNYLDSLAWAADHQSKPSAPRDK